MEQKELKIELSPEVAPGKYCNLAVISHSPQEIFLDFVTHDENLAADSDYIINMADGRIVSTTCNKKV